jgi:hypothetical protein
MERLRTTLCRAECNRIVIRPFIANCMLVQKMHQIPDFLFRTIGQDRMHIEKGKFSCPLRMTFKPRKKFPLTKSTTYDSRQSLMSGLH